MNSILASLSAIIWCFIEPFLYVMADKVYTPLIVKLLQLSKEEESCFFS